MTKQPTTLGAFSVSLAVKDLQASRAFYEKLDFEVVGGDAAQNWLILRNGTVTIGLFQGMFERNILTFNPGWDEQAQAVEPFTDVREHQRRLKSRGLDAHERGRRERDRAGELHAGRSGRQSRPHRPARAAEALADWRARCGGIQYDPDAAMIGLTQTRRIASGVLVLALTLRGSAQIIPGAGRPAWPAYRDDRRPGRGCRHGRAGDEAIVRLTMSKYFESPAAPNGRVMADGEGRFFFTDLPAGEDYLQATKDGYAPGTYGQRRAWGQNELLSLAEGERPTDVKLGVWKYGAIAGTVVDEAGEPVVGIAVRALVKNVVAGRTQFGNMEVIPELVPGAITDDRGMFRLSQLVPGTYVVLVPSTQTTLPAAWLAGQDSWLRTELFWGGVNEIALLGQPRTQQVGDAALMTLNSVLIPPPPSAEGRMAVYPTTFFPSAATAGAATPITVGAGEERTDVAIALRPVPAVRVTGRLVAPDGTAPPPTTIRLTGIAMTDVITSSTPSGPATSGSRPSPA